MPRVFIAIRIASPPPELMGMIRQIQRADPGLRLTNRDKLHLTLRFLGEVEQAVMGLIPQAMQHAIGQTRVFELRLKGLKAFPNPKRPSVIWVGVREQPILRGLVDGLDEALTGLGFPLPTKRWTPHITLSRIKRKPALGLFELLETQADTPLGAVRVEAIELMTSQLTPSGAVHTVEHTGSLV